MRYLSLLLIAAIILGACNKNGDDKPASETITGRWNIISDSMYTGAGANNHLEVFTGNADSYYLFNSNGTLEVRENGINKNYPYQNTSTGDIIIKGFLPDAPADTASYTIFNLTSINLQFGTEIIVATPGGTWARRVSLIRPLEL